MVALLVQVLLLLTHLSRSAIAGVAGASSSASCTFNATHSFSFNEANIQSLSFTFRTSYSIGTLLSIVANDSQLLLVTVGNGSLLVNGNDTEVVVTDGEWHELDVEFSNSSAHLSVDNEGENQLLPAWDPSLSLNVSMGRGFRGCVENLTTVDNNGRETSLNVSGVNPNLHGCHPDPCTCAHNATCTQSQWSLYTGCNCTREYFSGRLCQEVDFCLRDSRNCSGRGVCINEANGYRCDCEVGYSGSRCEFQLNTCDRVKGVCRNGGECVNLQGVDAFECNCTNTGFTGVNCTQPEADEGVSDGNTTSGASVTVTVLVMLPVLLVMGVTGAVLVIRRVRQQRKEVGVYKPSERELHSKYGLNFGSVLRFPNNERLI